MRVAATEDFGIEAALRYECGEPMESIARAMCCSSGTVHRVLKARGVRSRPSNNWHKPMEQRFWRRVAKGAPDDCWLWQGCIMPSGYGQITTEKGRHTSAQRVSFFLANGYWPNVTRHTCDNPPCVNPAHLLDGDTADNSRDMVERGRSSRGSKRPMAKLTEQDVSEIRARAPYTRADHLAREYGVSDSCISEIKSGKRWRHVE